MSYRGYETADFTEHIFFRYEKKVEEKGIENQTYNLEVEVKSMNHIAIEIIKQLRNYTLVCFPTLSEMFSFIG